MDSSFPNPHRGVMYMHQHTLDQIDDLRSELMLLRRRQSQHASQWRAASAEQRQHCCDLASLYQQLQELLTNHLDGAAEAGHLASSQSLQPHNSPKSGIREILDDHRKEIERGNASCVVRLENVLSVVEELRGTLMEERQRRELTEERFRRLEERHEKLVELIGNTVTRRDLNALSDELREVIRSSERETALTSTPKCKCISNKFACFGEQRSVNGLLPGERGLCAVVPHHEELQSIEASVQRLQQSAENLREKMRAYCASSDVTQCERKEVETCRLREMLTSFITKVSEHMEVFSKHVDEKCEWFMESATGTTPQVPCCHTEKLEQLHGEIKNIQCVLQRHGEALNDQFLNDPSQGTFQELREWLQDVEQSAVKRSEFHEAIVSIEEKLASFKRELLMGEAVTRATGGLEGDLNDELESMSHRSTSGEQL
uniref:Uncharacterized protein TCIL3000_11_11570 n=1 Tax=Trypanosoma congolense (strain IL3000) TaxID=1068625 RepID=G0V1Z4_TRYCI|nr:unnamed protein product [Trypanosoma congolense IL3000]